MLTNEDTTMTQRIKITWKAMMKGRHNLLKNLSDKRTDHSQSNGKGRKPVPMLSGASKCVWQMDREA